MEEKKTYVFDKFIDDIVEREDAARRHANEKLNETNDETWGRKRDMRNRDYASNNICYRKG